MLFFCRPSESRAAAEAGLRRCEGDGDAVGVLKELRALVASLSGEGQEHAVHMSGTLDSMD